MSSCCLSVLALLPALTVTRTVQSEVWRAEVVREETLNTRHCSSPSGSVDGKILVEDDGGQMTDFTTITWQIGEHLVTGVTPVTSCDRAGGDSVLQVQV